MRFALAPVVVVFGFSVTACGGEELGTTKGGADGGDGSASDGQIPDSTCTIPGLDCAHEEPPPQDAPTTTSDAESEEGVTCTKVGRNAFNNGPNCTMSTVEKCSDGIKYEASCSCQAGKCFCSITTGSQGTGTSVPFVPPGCPSSCSISAEEALKECGYPF
jgi:hypothetical protein